MAQECRVSCNQHGETSVSLARSNMPNICSCLFFQVTAKYLLFINTTV